MDWLQGIQTAVDYIEAHLAEKISYEEIAKHAYSSTYHFSGYSECFAAARSGNISAEENSRLRAASLRRERQR